MILFCDENIPFDVARALAPLAGAGCKVVHLLDHLKAGTKDEAVFTHVAKIEAHLLTQDARIRRRLHQLEALKQAGVGAFIVSGKAERDMSELAILLIRALPEIRSRAADTRRPFVYAISDRGKLERLI